MRFALVLPLVLSLASQAWAAEFNPVGLSSKQLAQIKAVITYDLIDPESARFRNIRAVDVTRNNGKVEHRACGEVNAKNSLGGYTGFRMFGGVIDGGVFKRKDFFGACEKW